MIDFRYHLVSIVAIFLALAVGIVLGSTVLNAPLVASTERITATLRANNNDLHAQLTDLQARGGSSDAFVAERLPQLVQGALAGARVVIVEAPGADTKLRDPLQQVITAAGATISGRVTITEKFLTARPSVLDQLVATAKPSALTFPADATPHGKAAAVLASALVTPDRTQAGKSDSAEPDVLKSFESDGLVSIDGDPGRRATLAVVLAPAVAYEGETAEAHTAAVVSLAGGLDAASEGAVMVGAVPTSATGGAIAALRASSDLTPTVSTVDNADMAFGQAVVVYALREQVGGDAGQYGLASDATAVEPPPAPRPTPTEASGG